MLVILKKKKSFVLIMIAITAEVGKLYNRTKNVVRLPNHLSVLLIIVCAPFVGAHADNGCFFPSVFVSCPTSKFFLPSQ